MPTSNHTFAGTVQALQWTGNNLSEIEAALGSGWNVYTSVNTTTIAPCQPGNERFGLNGNLVNETDWLVSIPSYNSNIAPVISGGFVVVTNANFTQQYV